MRVGALACHSPQLLLAVAQAAKLRTHPACNHARLLQVVGLTEGYHGDTLGAMDAVAPSPFNGRMQTPWFTGRGMFLEPPTVAVQQGAWRVALPPDMAAAADAAASAAAAVVPGSKRKPFAVEYASQEAVFDLAARSQPGGGGAEGALASLYPFYLRHIEQQLHDYCGGAQGGPRRHLGALVLEPVLQGAGGMRLVDPLFQRALVEACRWARWAHRAMLPPPPAGCIGGA